MFNEVISALSLVDLPLQGRRYTWSNKQQPPLLEIWIGFLLPQVGPYLSQILLFGQ